MNELLEILGLPYHIPFYDNEDYTRGLRCYGYPLVNNYMYYLAEADEIIKLENRPIWYSIQSKRMHFAANRMDQLLNPNALAIPWVAL